VIALAWSDVPPEEVAALAQRAFQGKDARLQERIAVYAWAHRLRETFYSAAIAVKMGAASSGSGGELVERLLARADAHFAK
jgi:hypothetical protein